MRKSFLCTLSGLLFLLLPAGCSTDDGQRPDVVFMDNFKIFEGFEMKKDYDLLIEKEMAGEQRSLDSLARSLDGVTNSIELAARKTELYERQQQFDQQFGELSDTYTKEVYARLNEYITAYGKEKGFKIILGSTGVGNVMYVDTTVNVTADLLKYANSRYKN
jgi:outer membrane protein